MGQVRSICPRLCVWGPSWECVSWRLCVNVCVCPVRCGSQAVCPRCGVVWWLNLWGCVCGVCCVVCGEPVCGPNVGHVVRSCVETKGKANAKVHVGELSPCGNVHGEVRPWSVQPLCGVTYGVVQPVCVGKEQTWLWCVWGMWVVW